MASCGYPPSHMSSLEGNAALSGQQLGHLKLLKRKLRTTRRSNSRGGAELSPLPSSPPRSASPTSRGSLASAPAAFGNLTGVLALRSPQSSPLPRDLSASDVSASPLRGSDRLKPQRRIASVDGRSNFHNSMQALGTASSQPATAADFRPASGAQDSQGFNSSTRPPLPKRNAISVGPRGGRAERSREGTAEKLAGGGYNGTAPLPLQRRRRDASCPLPDELSEAVATKSASSKAPPLPSAQCFGQPTPASIWSAICSFLGVQQLPAYRRLCLICHRAVGQRLAKDGGLRSNLEAHLELRRLKSKRVWVVMRARPQTDAGNCISIDRNRIICSGGGPEGRGSSFFFDRAFGGDATQREVCDYVGDKVLHHALNGEHICLLAYGQTGSGKTYTMFGNLDDKENQGIAFTAMNRLAALIRERGSCGLSAPTVELSFLEVYNNELYDLLDGSRQLPRQRSSEKHCVPQGLTRRRCDLGDMESKLHGWLKEGASTRTVGKTVFNPRSSRSHAVVMLHICWGAETRTSTRLLPHGRPDVAAKGETRVYIVDLAGSERAGLYALAPEQLKEGEHINLSLSALGRVVSALASGKCSHVPYRDSALTWLLKDAITGDTARVCMVAAVHPAHAVETASTLRYARQYSCLQSSGNSRVTQLAQEVRELQRKVDNLKNLFEKGLAEAAEDGTPWTRESLKGSVHCQPRRNARDFFDEHPYLVWTPNHQSKAAVRGQRRDKSSVGYIRTSVEIPPPRDPADKPDGRPLAAHLAAATASPKDDEVAKSAEVVYQGRNNRPDTVLWYPEPALDFLQPPRPLLDSMEKLQTVEEEMAVKKAELSKAKSSKQQKQEDWMATA
eukprot:TRINITY_DN9926_c0_g1_i1.p1 TRINITY_DN9926_c0_g1~~TRINITY_DN9926_c0_g1_i1.p1  ORF type:complete len:846 (+),score=180.96 TRINITY_DN9926_c0_g1_i1:142-2679(+)